MNVNNDIIRLREHLGFGQLAAASQLAEELLRQPSVAVAQAICDAMDSADAGLAPARRVFFLSSFTIQPLLPLVRAYGLAAGIHLRICAAPFNSYAQQILVETSGLYTDNPDVIVLALHTRDVVPRLWSTACLPGEAEYKSAVQDTVRYVSDLLRELRRRTPADIIIQNFEEASFAANGPLDSQSPEGQIASVHQLNTELITAISSVLGVYILDSNALAGRHGRKNWFDPYRYITMRMPYTAAALAPLAREYVKIITALSGRTCKVLAVDLDNTLWGGVIGEDGLEGIQLGVEYPGGCFAELQRQLLYLHSQGFILCICSKNNDADARYVLERHPAMLLKPSHFTILKANWNEKVENLRAIAFELNLGLDSFAFLDDNPAECARVRQELPQVHVIQLPQDPTLYADCVRDSLRLTRITVSDDDRRRNDYYQWQKQTDILRSSSTSLEEFYYSLQMRARFEPVGPGSIARAAQITQRTNQFNLTTHRYTEQQIAAFSEDPACATTLLRIQDRFGDSGIVGLAILRLKDTECEIDTLLLSCRVIGRTVETALLAHICEIARSRQATVLIGDFVRTAKNQPAERFYGDHGFRPIRTSSDVTTWHLPLENAAIECPAWISIERTDTLNEQLATA